jgi:hypothetical protein
MLVVREMTLLVDRLCDPDQDGLSENAVADLGAANAEVFAWAMTTTLAGSLERGVRMAVFFPWIDDLQAPADEDAVMLVFQAVDTDRPPNRGDDFSGDEPLYAKEEYIDPCGEPRSAARAWIDRGVLLATTDELRLPLMESRAIVLLLRGLSLAGTLPAGVREGQLTICGYAAIRDLGSWNGMSGEGLSLLEDILGGGRAFGMPTVPGLTPDADMDGDGAERFVLDASGRIQSCIDGDGSSIEGPDCWQDPRMADGITVAIGAELVGARFAGRRPDWPYLVEGACDAGPPAESLFDSPYPVEGPCAGPDEICDPSLGDPCCDPGQICSGANRMAYRCTAAGCTPQPCDYGGQPGFCVPAWSPLAAGEGLCQPADGRVDPAAQCTPGASCTTAHGSAASTLCTLVTERLTQCFERCTLEGDACDSDHACAPVPSGEGLCSTWQRDALYDTYPDTW